MSCLLISRRQYTFKLYNILALRDQLCDISDLVCVCIMDHDLDVQYSPSHWSKRYSKELVVSKHVEVVSKVSKLVKESVPFETISYGPEETSRVDIYGTSLSKDSPIFVYIHGGYWQELSKDISNYPVLPLVESGIRVFVPGYCLAPEASVGDIIEQIKRLGEYVLKEATQSGTRSVWFGGHSAGAHLAASLLDEEWFKRFDQKVQNIFKGLILISGIYDLVPIVQTYVNEPLRLDEAKAFVLSPINKDLQWFTVLKQDFKILLAVAENDSPSFKNQTSDYEKFLRTQNISTELMNLKGMDHFDIVENLSEKAYPLTASITGLILNSSQ